LDLAISQPLPGGTRHPVALCIPMLYKVRHWKAILVPINVLERDEASPGRLPELK